jgi:hypothetical protein
MIAMKKLHPRVFGILLSASPAVSALEEQALQYYVYKKNKNIPHTMP